MRVKPRYCRTTRIFRRAKKYGRLHLSGYRGKAVNGKALYQNRLVTKSSIWGKYRSRLTQLRMIILKQLPTSVSSFKTVLETYLIGRIK